MGYDHGLEACVILNPGTLAVSKGLMADTLEAIIGAVELDGGSEALRRVVTRLGLVHALISSVTSNLLLLSLQETISTINLVTSSAPPSAISMSFTHGYSSTFVGMVIA